MAGTAEGQGSDSGEDWSANKRQGPCIKLLSHSPFVLAHSSPGHSSLRPVTVLHCAFCFSAREPVRSLVVEKRTCQAPAWVSSAFLAWGGLWKDPPPYNCLCFRSVSLSLPFLLLLPLFLLFSKAPSLFVCRPCLASFFLVLVCSTPALSLHVPWPIEQRRSLSSLSPLSCGSAAWTSVTSRLACPWLLTPPCDQGIPVLLFWMQLWGR